MFLCEENFCGKFFHSAYEYLYLYEYIHFPLFSPYLGISIYGSKLEGGWKGVTMH